MYKIRLTRKNNRITVKKVTQPIRLTTKQPNIRLKHTGARGIPGPAGPPGAGIPAGGQADYVLQKASDADHDYKWMQPTYSDKNYTASFGVASSVTVDHNLNKYPTVAVINSAGDEVECEVYYVNTSQLILSFSAPFSGRVTCN